MKSRHIVGGSSIVTNTLKPGYIRWQHNDGSKLLCHIVMCRTNQLVKSRK